MVAAVIHGERRRGFDSATPPRHRRDAAATSSTPQVKTTKQTKRGGTPYAAFVNNTVEFSEGALMYKGTGATIRGNYLAFNSFEARGSYTLDNMAQRSVVTDNTLLYVRGADISLMNRGDAAAATRIFRGKQRVVAEITRPASVTTATRAATSPGPGATACGGTS